MNKICSMLVVLVVFFLTAASSPPGWNLTLLDAHGNYRLIAAPDRTVVFEQASSPSLPADCFFTTSTDASVLGNLAGRTIVCIFELIGDATFRSTPEADCLDLGPPDLRLYFSTRDRVYNVGDGVRNRDNYWWSAWNNPVVLPLSSDGTFTVRDTFDPAHWSNAMGNLGTGRPGFDNAVRNVKQIGVCFSSGRCYYDLGVTTTLEAQGIFRLVNFKVE